MIKKPIATFFPNLCKEWNQYKNGGLKPEQCGVGYNKKVWWICLVNVEHEW